MERKRVGRPTKINKTIIETICNYVEKGNYVETAAAAAGISRSTLYEWLRRGAREIDRLESDPAARPLKSERLYVEFSDTLTRATALAEIRDVEIMNRMIKEGVHQVLQFKLERRNPKHWGRMDRLQAEIEQKGSVGINLVISYGDDDDEDPDE